MATEKKKSSFADNYNVIFEQSLPLSENRELKFQFIEHKKTGAMQASVREHKHTPEYDGPTSNGVFLKVSSPEALRALKEQFQAFFDKVEESI